MKTDLLNLCQVTLGTDAEIVNENLTEFNKIYKNVKLFVVCPSKDKEIFIKTLVSKNYKIITEDELISLDEFTNIFEKLSENLTYKKEFKKRLSWYYAITLKFCFIHKFFETNDSNLIIWEGDTVILKKIKFFENSESKLYTCPAYFHKLYFDTCEKLLGIMPKFYSSFITMFGSMTKKEINFLFESLNLNNINNKKFNILFSEKVLQSVFDIHKTYNNSMFADYELIGINSLNLKFKKQIPIFFLRSALDGKLTSGQKLLAKLFNVKHFTYEHRHPNKHSTNMLSRNQTWVRFLKILIFFYYKFKIEQIRFNFKYLFNNKI